MFDHHKLERKDCIRKIRMGDITVQVRPKDMYRYGKHATVVASGLTGIVTTVPHWDAALDQLHHLYMVTINGQEQPVPATERELKFFDF